jgi:hypothetical protein
MKIAVLVTPAVHPVSGRPCAGEADLAALAWRSACPASCKSGMPVPPTMPRWPIIWHAVQTTSTA